MLQQQQRAHIKANVTPAVWWINSMVLASCPKNITIASVPLLESPRLDKHFAGATFFDWTKDGVDEDEEAPVQLQIDSDTFAAEMEAKGVGTDRPVVVSCPSRLFHSPNIDMHLVYTMLLYTAAT
jgi:3-mercaptopyruvate sulfurtransferase SseA